MLTFSSLMWSCSSVWLQMWIQMKMPLATSNDIGNSLQSVQTLQKKNNSLRTEIEGHELRITELCSRAKAIVEEGHPQSQKIEEAIQELQDMWQQLLDAMKERKAKLIDSEKAQEVGWWVPQTCIGGGCPWALFRSRAAPA